MTDGEQRRTLGIECKFQKSSGSADEKVYATLQDIDAWPIRGIICFDGPGFREHIRAALLASGKGVELEDLETWLRLYFVL